MYSKSIIVRVTKLRMAVWAKLAARMGETRKTFTVLVEDCGWKIYRQT
jgi:hypothetical protein